MKNVVITVTRITPLEFLDPDDLAENPAGTYTFRAFNKNEQRAIEEALDEFHASIPIACLDDWRIEAEVQS